jgi:hypothetical protein
MLDIPLEDLLSLIVVLIAVIINLIVFSKSYKAYKANKMTQTILFAFTAFFMAFAMIFLVGEKVFLSSILHDRDMGLLLGSIAIILSGFTVAAVDSFAFNMAWPTKFKTLTGICVIPIIIYLALWLSDPERDVEWSPTTGSGEIVVGSITTNAVYFTLVPLLIMPVLVFFYYAIKVSEESPVSSKRSWVLGLGVMTISFAYIFEIIGLAAIIEIEFLPAIIRIFFSIGALLMYWALFKIKAKQ